MPPFTWVKARAFGGDWDDLLPFTWVKDKGVGEDCGAYLLLRREAKIEQKTSLCRRSQSELPGYVAERKHKKTPLCGVREANPWGIPRCINEYKKAPCAKGAPA